MTFSETVQSVEEKKPLLYRLIYRIAGRLFPVYERNGTENLPDEPCVLVGNHCQMYGPVAAEMHLPRPCSIWCIGEIMNRKEAADYAYRDFWSLKPRCVRWFFRLLSCIVGPLLSFVLSNAHTIPVYRDARVLTTFRKSIALLQQGSDIVIFPETAEPYNGIIWKFQEHFTDIARLYYRKTGDILRFVPMYIAPRLGRICFGSPLPFDPSAEEEPERKRLCTELMDAITALAASLPTHAVVPYPNIPKSQYPLNTDAGCVPSGSDVK